MFGTPPRQGNLPKGKVQITEHQKFTEPTMARVEKNDAYWTKGQIEVLFLNRTKPVPVWVLDSGACPKPEVGDYVLIGYVDGQKNNPYMAGIVAHKAWTSNFIRVEKGMIRIQFPTDPKDVNQGKEEDPNSHMRDDATYLGKRAYIQLDASGIMLSLPDGLDVNVKTTTGNVNITQVKSGNMTLKQDYRGGHITLETDSVIVNNPDPLNPGEPKTRTTL